MFLSVFLLAYLWNLITISLLKPPRTKSWSSLDHRRFPLLKLKIWYEVVRKYPLRTTVELCALSQALHMYIHKLFWGRRLGHPWSMLTTLYKNGYWIKKNENQKIRKLFVELSDVSVQIHKYSFYDKYNPTDVQYICFHGSWNTHWKHKLLTERIHQVFWYGMLFKGSDIISISLGIKTSL